MDYKELLLKYMRIICDRESFSYLRGVDAGDYGLTQEDVDALGAAWEEATK